MKNLVVGTFALLFTVVAASANVYVSWQADAGFNYTATPGSGFLGTGQSALAQLIWTPNNTGGLAGVSGADEANANNPNYLSGDDVFLDSIILTEGSNTSEWGDFTGQVIDDGGANPSGGYIYARIFESDTVNAGTQYYVGPVVAADDIDTSATPPPATQSYNMNRNFGDPIDGTYGFEAVPEPGTMGLLALGLVTLGGAARKRRKTRA